MGKSKLSDISLYECLLDDSLDMKDGKILYKGKYLEEELENIIKSNNKIKDKLEVIDIEDDEINNLKVEDIYDGIVYMISSKNTDNIYIGSTVGHIDKRLEGHIVSYYAYDRYRMDYCASYEVLRYGDYNIEEICRYRCNKKELERYESLKIREYGSRCVNVVDPFSRKIIEGKELEKVKRKEEKWNRLFDIGKKCLNINGMTRDELIILKDVLIKKINKDIFEYGKRKAWVEFKRLGKISDDVFK